MPKLKKDDFLSFLDEKLDELAEVIEDIKIDITPKQKTINMVHEK